jgi:hypothetical protein
MDFSSCKYNYSLYNFTTHKQKSCLGFVDSSELLVENFLSLTLRVLSCTVNWNWSRVGVKVALRLTVGQSVSLGVEPTLWQLRSSFCGAPSQTRGRICLLYKLLVLASVFLFGSESLGTRDHILQSHIRDFPFRRLLRLAGSRWRYSTPPPHGFETEADCSFSIVISRRTE